MEAQTKPAGFNGVQAAPTPEYTIRARVSSPVQLTGYILRVVVIVLTFISAIVMGAAKEKVTFATVGGALSMTVKSADSSAFIYFIVMNVFVFLYSSVTLAMSFVNRWTSSRGLQLIFTIADLVAALLLFSSNSAAAAVGVLAENGLDKVGWLKICDTVDKFCSHVTGAIVLSMFAALAYVVLVLLAILGLHKRA